MNVVLPFNLSQSSLLRVGIDQCDASRDSLPASIGAGTHCQRS